MRDSLFASRTKRAAAVFYIRFSLQKVARWEAQEKQADEIRNCFLSEVAEGASLSRLSHKSSGEI